MPSQTFSASFSGTFPLQRKDVVNPCLEFASPTDRLVVTAAVRPQLSFSISVFFLKLVHSGLSSTSDSVVELVLVGVLVIQCGAFRQVFFIFSFFFQVVFHFVFLSVSFFSFPFFFSSQCHSFTVFQRVSACSVFQVVVLSQFVVGFCGLLVCFKVSLLCCSVTVF